jgi:uncharacterized protein (TIGR03435 family)
MLRIALVLVAAPLLHAQFTIQPSTSENQSLQLKNGMLDAEGQTVEQLLQFAYHLQAGTVIGPAWIGEKNFDVHGAKSQLQQALTEHFKLDCKRETRPMDVFVLKATPDAEARLTSSGAVDTDGMSHIRGTNLSAESIARYLSSWLGKPVIDETGLHGQYAVNITWDANNSNNLISAVERAGLRLEKDRRLVEALVVTEK